MNTAKEFFEKKATSPKSSDPKTSKKVTVATSPKKTTPKKSKVAVATNTSPKKNTLHSSSKTRSPSKSYLVLKVYYKHGGYNLTYCKTERSLFQHLWDYIDEHDDYTNYDADDWNSMSTKEVIEEVLKIGDRVLDDQAGMGIVAIIEVNSSTTFVHGGVHETI